MDGEEGGQKHYLIYHVWSHPLVHFARGNSTLDAVEQFIRGYDENVRFLENGTLEMAYNRKVITYPHPLAFIEARYRIFGQWQIREVADWMWERGFVREILCGYSEDTPDWPIREARKYLRQTHPRSTARAFVWHLHLSEKWGHNGDLVTFYRLNRRKRPFQIEIVRRCLVDYSTYAVTDWEGTYDDIVRQLNVGRERIR